MPPTPSGTDLRHAAVRRLAAYGAVTRMTGHPDAVTVAGEALILDDGHRELVLQHGDGTDGPAAPPIPADWRTDEAADRVATQWIEDYLEDTYQLLVIRRDYITDLVADPFATLHLDRLASRFPHPHRDEIDEFLADVRQWLLADAQAGGQQAGGEQAGAGA